MKFIKVFLIVILASSVNSFGQFSDNIKVAAGIITSQIVNNNSAKSSVLVLDSQSDFIPGGSFRDAQVGAQILFTSALDKEDRFRIPFGIGYMFYNGKERVSVNENIVTFSTHDVNILELSTGIHYVLGKVNIANANVYTGLELKWNYIHNDRGTIITKYTYIPDNDIYYDIPAKENTSRIGGGLKLGADGKLWDRVYINAGATLHWVNMLGKDNARGELLTAKWNTFKEMQESEVLLAQVFILIQYNL